MIRSFITAVLLGLVALTLSATSAFAHASLLATTPADNAVLAAAPHAVEMQFNEPVGILLFTLLGPDGLKRDLTSVTKGGETVSVPLPDGLPQGTEALTWHIVSADGHPVAGTLIFSIGHAAGAIEQAGTDPALAVIIWLARLLVYTGLFIGAGSFVFGAIAPLPEAARRIGFVLVGVGAVAAVLSIPLQGADGLGLNLAALVDPRAWATGWSTTYSLTIVAILIAYALAVASATVAGLPRNALALLTLLVIGLSLTLSGHASAADPQWLTRPAVFVHVVAVSFWIGSLLPLALLLLKGGADAERALARFSAIIPYALLPLVIAGIALAVVQLGAIGPSWLTPYAAILGAKLVMVLLLLALAAWNRWRLTPQAGDTAGRRRLVLSVRAEIVLVLIVLGLVAGWRFTVPPRAIAQELAAPVLGQAMGGDLMAELSVLPGRVGETSITISLTDMQMAPINPLSVKLSLTQAAEGVGPIEADTAKGSDGAWHADHVTLPVGGAWTASIDARTGTFDITTLTGSFTLPSTEPAMKVPAPIAAAAVSSALLAAPAVASDAFLASCPTGQIFTVGDITVSGAYSRATLKGAASAAGYLTIHNSGSTADVFTGVTSPAATDVTLHQMKMNGQVMEMSDLPNGVPVLPGGDVSFDPMSYHLMLTGLAGPLVQGQCVPMVLHFAKAGDVAVQFNIGGIAQSAPVTDGGASSLAQPMSSMDMGGNSSMSGM